MGQTRTDLALAFLQANTFSNSPSVSTTFSAHADYTRKPDMLPDGRLKVGLLDPFSNATTFTSVHFSIDVEGVIVEDRTFFNRATADSYFNDSVLDLGPIVDSDGEVPGYNFAIHLELTGLDNGTIYGSKFIVAAVAEDLPGDFNHDNVVDAADYVVWRKQDGAPGGYNLWRTNFGATLPVGSGSMEPSMSYPAVPEPASAMLFIIGMSMIFFLADDARRCCKLMRR